MGHNILAPLAGGPRKALGWPLAEGKPFLGASPQPDPTFLTVAPSVAAFFFSRVGCSTENLPSEAGGSLARPSGSCHRRVWLPAWAGWAGPVEKLKVELIFPHPQVIALVPLKGPWSLGSYSTT